MFDNLWVEKYRPKKLEDFCISEKSNFLNFLTKCKDDNEIPNLLLVGNPGIGKTTIAKIIVNELLECDHLYINASDENGIDTIRSKVTSYARTKSLFDIKVIILDECDGLTQDGQRALRNVMEEYSAITRFILTANYKHKIIPALQSRCQSLSIKPVVELAVKRCYNILKDEKVKVPEEQKKKFVQLVKRHFPDLRKTINELQKNIIDSELCIVSVTGDNELLEAVYKKIASKNSLEARRYLIENEDRFQGDYDTLLGNYLNFIYTANIEDLKKKEMIAIIADHLYKSAFVVDKEINAFACLVNLENSLS